MTLGQPEGIREKGFRVKSDFYVYVLFRADGTPFYVGRGRGWRWALHESHARLGKEPKSRRLNIIRAMFAAGWTEIPKIKLREDLTNQEANDIERALIVAIGRSGKGPLVNETDGGDGTVGHVRSLESRAKQSAAYTSEKRAKASALKKGIPRSPEVRAKVSAAKKGQRLSLETRAKISAALTGLKRGPASPESIARSRAANLGRKIDPLVVAKVSAANRGRKRTAEFCLRQAIAGRGRKHSEETKLKISAKRTAYEAARRIQRAA